MTSRFDTGDTTHELRADQTESGKRLAATERQQAAVAALVPSWGGWSAS